MEHLCSSFSTAAAAAAAPPREVADECRCSRCEFAGGVRVYANGNRYEGPFREGKCEGKGRVLYADGSEYEGTFHLGVRQENT